MRGHALCLTEHTPPGASHTAYCLPSNKPENCLQSSWSQLKDVFEGDCPENQRPAIGGLGGLPPPYLQVSSNQSVYYGTIHKRQHFLRGYTDI